MVLKILLLNLTLLSLSLSAHAFLKNAGEFCTEQDIAQKILKQTTPLTAYRHGDSYAFLAFQKQRDLSLMFDRVGDFSTAKTIDPNYVRDREVEGYALAPKDMVAFFNYAHTHKSKLNAQEKKLQAALIEYGSMALENNQYVLKKPVYIAAAYKGCDQGTAEHELNHVLYDSNPTYKAAVKKFYDSLGAETQAKIKKALNKMGYDNKTLSDPDNLLGEFSAFFRDTKVLRSAYKDETAHLNKKEIDTIGTALLKLESDNNLFKTCPSKSPQPNNPQQTPEKVLQ